jgi:hypothetical protein
MTILVFYGIVGSGIKQDQRSGKGYALRALDGKAMLQIHTYRFKSLYRLYNLPGTIMPSADKAERLILTCLNQTGLSGNLGPDAPVRILE